MGQPYGATIRSGRRCQTAIVTPLVPSTDVYEAEWYGAALAGFGGRVECVIPQGYEAYARILHPASGDRGAPVRWAEVAESCGRVLHPLAQFHAIAGRWVDDPRSGAGWPGENSEEGTLDAEQLRVLCDLIAGHTTTPDVCWLTVWEGYGQLPDSWWRSAPRVRQPNRLYYLFQRPLRDVVTFSAQVAAGTSGSGVAVVFACSPAPAPDSPPAEGPREWVQSPNQWWPADRAWCVATEIDFDSTLVAGTEGLVEEILRHPALEAFRVAPTDDLTHAGDRINPQPVE